MLMELDDVGIETTHERRAPMTIDVLAFVELVVLYFVYDRWPAGERRARGPAPTEPSCAASEGPRAGRVVPLRPHIDGRADATEAARDAHCRLQGPH
jgi:hypothetical protein